MQGEHAGSVADGILQLHPSRRCNLACSHCYSSSSPTEGGGLAPEVVVAAIEDAAALGHNIISLSAEALGSLETLAATASDWGAALLQLHPFERSGRGVDAREFTPLSPDQMLDAFLVAAVLADQFPRLGIQLDLVRRDVARYAPAAIHGATRSEPMVPQELVLQAEGRLVPLAYGLGNEWSVAGAPRSSKSWSIDPHSLSFGRRAPSIKTPPAPGFFHYWTRTEPSIPESKFDEWIVHR